MPVFCVLEVGMYESGQEWRVTSSIKLSASITSFSAILSPGYEKRSGKTPGVSYCQTSGRRVKRVY